MKSGIYKITNKVDGKFYIGSSGDIENRWISHKRDLRSQQHINPKLQHAWDFHGEDSFVFDVIETVEPKPTLLFERENHYLSKLKPYIRGVGYNICPTAQGGDNFTHNPNKEKTRELLRNLSMGENNGMYGKKHTKEAIKQQKEKPIGRYTLEWFVERHGDGKGKEKFEKRRKMLMSRPKKCFSHKESPVISFKGRKHNKSLGRKQRKTHSYFLNHWNEFVKMIKSGNYSQRQLSSMLSISRPTLRIRMRQVLKQ